MKPSAAPTTKPASESSLKVKAKYQDSKICANLSYYRRRIHLTQREVGQLLGIRPSRYGQWESYWCEPSSKYIVLLADIFGITTDELLGRQFPAFDYTGTQL